ncbi:MazG-like nucleotide pyrophosphohydrolase [Gordonia phage DatBoi]|nr:MazG-like nucleotide pyrophosphohydrolase [Gordonia phage DatBoi]
MTVFTDVQEFHDAAEVERPSGPTVHPIPHDPEVRYAVVHLELASEAATAASKRHPDSVALRRIRLMVEELHETVDAMVKGDLPKIADGLADCGVVNAGTADEYGIDLDAVHALVHGANMAKVNPETGKFDKDEAGKIIKPVNWVAPDAAIAELVGVAA